MALRSGIYIVPTNRWYIERTVWLIAGVVLLASTALALLVNRPLILGVTATWTRFHQRRLYRILPGRQRPSVTGLPAMLGSDKSKHWYFIRTDKWYLERRI
jgi:hypothetical protein